jgi:hypothetical protein
MSVIHHILAWAKVGGADLYATTTKEPGTPILFTSFKEHK